MPENEIRIRRMIDADIEEVKKLETASGLSPWLLEDYRREISRRDSVAFVAEREREVIGFLVARLITTESIPLSNSSPRTESKQAFSTAITETEPVSYFESEIYNIAVREDYRKQNIGTLLLAGLIENTGPRKLRRTFLEVRESNAAAIGFYFKNGFEITGRRRCFYADPTEDALIMCRNERPA
jgi:ribosomal-protein-alanine acetyltransferase